MSEIRKSIKSYIASNNIAEACIIKLRDIKGIDTPLLYDILKTDINNHLDTGINNNYTDIQFFIAAIMSLSANHYLVWNVIYRLKLILDHAELNDDIRKDLEVILDICNKGTDLT